MSPPSIPSSTRPARGASGNASSVPEDVQFALETLHNLTIHCPNWAKRLDELSDQIDQRQIDLARFAEQQSPGHKSLRNRGSTESLKPKDDGEAHPGTDGRISPEDTSAVEGNCQRTSGLTKQTTQNDPPSPNEANSPTSSAVERQKTQVAAAATAKARAALRRSQLGKRRNSATESMLTGDGPALASKYRSKSLVIVYYDSYVQSFFEEVVKFVSASRNLMRKAKMAAKVAQIKRMAELEMPDDSSEGSDEDFGNGIASFCPPQLSPSVEQPDAIATTNGEGLKNADTEHDHCAAKTQLPNGNTNNATPRSYTPHRISTSQDNGKCSPTPSPLLSGPFRPSMAAWSSLSRHGKPAETKQKSSILDELDKSLELIQSMCEHAAHQFLRDGDCSDEIVNIKGRLMTTKAIADKELQVILEDDTDGSLKKSMVEGGPVRNRTYRPQIMRRDITSNGTASPSLKTSLVSIPGSGNGQVNGSADVNGAGFEIQSSPALEVDENIGGDAAHLGKDPPKFEFRSTRAMGPPVANRP